ncbi:hypothetical protein [Ferrovibrio xuzhouensis]|uniref:SMODS-associating 2TM beta-strand rich effector domain-containing protein n=1 Tax=Ferrovibrio xuzhouensis TaxID=1576914 RepID=A0ABV7VE21_9PROT
MSATISLVISSFALLLSALTAWLTLLRRGTVKMTRPTVIYFGPDGGFKDKAPLKVYFRCLLYATSKRGCVIESMYVRLKRGETTQNFNIWVYGEKQLSRGSGLFVPESGTAYNHHFLLPADGTNFQFLPGKYSVEVLAQLVGKATHVVLHAVNLEVSPEEARSITRPGQGLYFDWGPDAGKYYGHIKPESNSEIPIMLDDMIR